MTRWQAFVLIWCCCHYTLNARDTLLHSNWKFKQAGTNKWFPAKVPGTVHTDLLANELIPDPFFSNHETTLQWIEKKDWHYQTEFNCDRTSLLCKNIRLQFEGLDTYAEVFLNGKKILEAKNMFRTFTVDVTGKLREKSNQLLIIFHAAAAYADQQANAAVRRYPCENNRNFVRKAQYHFGWDWAPRFVTCGIWRNVKLCFDEVRQFAAPQYSPVKLHQEKDTIGQTFYFSVNGKPTFMQGANWIPADVFLPRITHEKYRSLLIAAKEAGMNMLRVWGGGIYEDDYFYDLCDSLDIYVWQDFMFAGAMYAADKASLENIKQEAIDNILRLRKHRCIALWCGNNEIDEAWHNWGWQSQFKIKSVDSANLWRDYQKIFHELLPGLVKQYDSGRAYIASSPLHGWGRQQSMTHGDSHYWGMWWGIEPIAVMAKKIPRFMSEYGMQAMPSAASMKLFLKPDEMDTASAAMKIHQKHPTGFQTLTRYLDMEKITYTGFSGFTEATQELQSRALQTALNAHLRSNGRCMGSLLWQYNDCWPVCSWSIIDYYGNPKKAYYTIQDLLKHKR